MANALFGPTRYQSYVSGEAYNGWLLQTHLVQMVEQKGRYVEHFGKSPPKMLLQSDLHQLQTLQVRYPPSARTRLVFIIPLNPLAKCSPQSIWQPVATHLVYYQLFQLSSSPLTRRGNDDAESPSDEVKYHV